MAKRGEGDPRWVVRERQDGRNVNGWHWEDKDVSEWAKNRLDTLMTDGSCHCVDPKPGVGVKKLETVDGDATLYNRKGVLKAVYDLRIIGKWTSDHVEESERTYGEFKIDLFDEDPEVITTMDPKSKYDNTYRRGFMKWVNPTVRMHCKALVRELHAGADQVLDGQEIPGAMMQRGATTTTTTSRTEMGRRTPPSQGTTTSGSKDMTSVTMVESFTCRPADWFLAFTDSARLSAVTRSRAVSDARVGGKWEVLGGAAKGEYVRLVPDEHIEMRWRLNAWGDGVQDGRATVSFKEEDGRTEVEVTVHRIPSDKTSEAEGFWRVQIFQAMRVVMGWGSASKFAYM